MCSPTLKKGLEQEKDFLAVPDAVWRRFLKWYGGLEVVEGEARISPVKRTVVVHRGESKVRPRLLCSKVVFQVYLCDKIVQTAHCIKLKIRKKTGKFR